MATNLTARLTLVRVALVVALVGLLAAGAVPAARAQDVNRVSGDTRVGTAVAVSSTHWDSARTAVLATSLNYPDALAAAALAARHDAPLLLTPRSALPPGVAAELVRLGADEVVVMGGIAAISTAVLQQVRDLPTAPAVRRIAGATRIETAAAAARAAGAPAGEAVIASALDFPDALAAVSLTATAGRLPVLLSGQDAVPEAAMAALADLDVTRVTLVGGSAVLSTQVVEQLRDAGYSVRRRWGPDRFSTAMDVVQDALDRFPTEPRTLIGATALDFPDALAAGALAARLDAPLLLVPHSSLGESLAAFVRERRERFSHGLVVGGPVAVADATLDDLADALAGREPAPAPGESVFGSGTWRVPGEVSPGLYRNSDSSGLCYWERLSGFGGELDDIIANGLSEEIMIVEIAAGDAGFSSDDCGQWSGDLSPRTPSPTADFGGGHYLVGEEIAPGTWRNSDSSGSCYWERLGGFSGELDDIIANGFSDSIQTVTIAEGDRGFWSEDCGTWTRLG